VEHELDLLPTQRSVFRSGLRSAEKLVALALLDHWSPGREVFPSVNRLAAWTSLDRTTVMRALDSLRARETIVVIQGERGKANRYELRQLSLLAPDQSHHATSRTMRPVAPCDLNQSHHATGVVAPCDPKEPIQGTQGRNPLESAPAQPGSPTEGAPKRKRAKRPAAPETPLPPDWQPTEAHRAYATKHGLDVVLEADSMRGWADGRTAVSWNGTFTTRLANQAKWNRQRGTGGGRNGTFVPQRGLVERPMNTAWFEKTGGGE
jgi:hypothetical protein